MTDSTADTRKYYGSTTVSGSASVRLGDDNHVEYGNRIYHIENAHFVPVPQGELARINDDFGKLPRPEVARVHGQDSQDRLAVLLDKISNYDASIAHWRRSCLRIESTCTWLFDHSEYLRWKQADSVVLTCIGPVGSGKSILAAAAIDHANETSSDASLVAHYYLESGMDHTTSLQDVLNALIKQSLLKLKDSRTGLSPALLTQIQDVATGPVNIASLSKVISLFEAIIAIMPHALFLVDGFDELSEEQLQNFLSVFRNLTGLLHSVGSKVAFFGREVLGRGINLQAQLPESCNINLRYVNIAQDVERFVDVQMERFQARRTITQNVRLLQQINTELKARGREMFLWIHFQLLTIWDPKLSKCDADIQKLLENLPSGLIDTYKSCLRRIESNEDQDIASTAFCWVAQAKQPLNSRQLREIASFRFDGKYLEESMVMNLCVTQYCANLLVIDNLGHVCFTHHSVLQLLSDTTKLGDGLDKYSLNPTDDSVCGKLCLEYLGHLQTRQQVAVRGEIQLPPDLNFDIVKETTGAQRLLKLATKFYRKPSLTPKTVSVPLPRSAPSTDLSIHKYITLFWLQHTRNITVKGDDFRKFAHLYRSSSSSLWPDMPNAASNKDLQRYFIRLAIYLDHVPLLHCVVEKAIGLGVLSNSVLLDDALFDNGSLAIHVAAALGHSDTVCYLLPHYLSGIRAESHDDCGKTPLCYAAENGHLETIRILVDNGRANAQECCQEFKPKDTEHPSYLSLSSIVAALPSSWCFLELMRSSHLHLPYTLDPQTMFAACMTGHHEIVDILHAYGSDMFNLGPFHHPDIQYQIQGSLIDLACREGNLAMLEFLLKYLQVDELLVLGSNTRICRDPIPRWAADALLESDDYGVMLTLNPAVRRERRAVPTDALCAKIQKCLHGSWRECLLALLFLINEAATDRKYRDILRESELMWPSTPPDDDIVDLQYLVRYARIPTNLSDDILAKLCSQEWFREAFPMQFWRRCLSKNSKRATKILEALEGRDIPLLKTDCLLDRQLELTQSIKNIHDFEDIWDKLQKVVLHEHTLQHLLESHRTQYVVLDMWHFQTSLLQLLKPKFAKIYANILDEPRSNIFDHRLRLLSMLNLVGVLVHEPRFWNCAQVNLLPHEIDALIDAGSDGNFDLNFPHGQIQKLKGKWQVKPFIISAVYRLNWRIRRRKQLGYSAADQVYCPIIAWQKSELSFENHHGGWRAWYHLHSQLKAQPGLVQEAPISNGSKLLLSLPED